MYLDLLEASAVSGGDTQFQGGSFHPETLRCCLSKIRFGRSELVRDPHAVWLEGCENLQNGSFTNKNGDLLIKLLRLKYQWISKMDPNTHLASLFSQTMTTLSIFKPEGNKVEPKKN